MNALKLVKPSTAIEKRTRTVVDTIMVTPDLCQSSAYQKLKAVFAARINAETGQKPNLPQPSWSHSGGAGKESE